MSTVYSFDLNKILNSLRECHVYGSSNGIVITATNKVVICRDGFIVSIQCGEFSYCSHRKVTFETVEQYTSFELGYPSESDPLILEYAEEPDNPRETVYPYVPRDIVTCLIRKHGGVSINEQEMLRALISQ